MNYELSWKCKKTFVAYLRSVFWQLVEDLIKVTKNIISPWGRYLNAGPAKYK